MRVVGLLTWANYVGDFELHGYCACPTSHIQPKLRAQPRVSRTLGELKFGGCCACLHPHSLRPVLYNIVRTACGGPCETT